MMKRLEPYIPPKWVSSLSYIPKYKISLAHLPTPICNFTFSKAQDRQISIKRDDLTEFLLSGNKIRKLEFLLADAIDQGCDCIITIGGIQSNHCRATAVAAKMLGLDCYLILRHTESLDKSIGFDGNLLIDRFVNAKIRLVTLEEYKKYGSDNLIKQLGEELKKEGKKPYLIPVGGSNKVGAWGYIEAIREIKEQIENQKLEFDDIVFACGSGGTASGLCLGAHLSNLNIKIHAISVCDNKEYFHSHVNETLQLLGVNKKSEDLLIVHDEYKGIGYAKNTKEELEMMRDIAFETGIMVDPVYSGKAMIGCLKDDAFKGRKVLFIHTGGVFGMYAQIPLLEQYGIIPNENIQPFFKE